MSSKTKHLDARMEADVHKLALMMSMMLMMAVGVSDVDKDGSQDIVAAGLLAVEVYH